MPFLRTLNSGSISVLEIACSMAFKADIGYLLDIGNLDQEVQWFVFFGPV